MHGDRGKRHDESLSLLTLIIGSVSSAAAAVIVHEIWRAGSILGAAVTPVLMTLFAEALRRPAERVTVRMPVRRAPLSHPSMPDATIREYRSRPRWRLAAITGLAAFVLGAAGLTVAEVVLQRSVADGHAGTTLFDTRPQRHSAMEAQPPCRPQEPASEAAPDRRRPPRPHTHVRRARTGSSDRFQTPSPTVTATPTPTPGPAQPPGQPTPTPAPQPTPSPG
jgi:hypothetical protein